MYLNSIERDQSILSFRPEHVTSTTNIVDELHLLWKRFLTRRNYKRTAPGKPYKYEIPNYLTQKEIKGKSSKSARTEQVHFLLEVNIPN